VDPPVEGEEQAGGGVPDGVRRAGGRGAGLEGGAEEEERPVDALADPVGAAVPQRRAERRGLLGTGGRPVAPEDGGEGAHAGRRRPAGRTSTRPRRARSRRSARRSRSARGRVTRNSATTRSTRASTVVSFASPAQTRAPTSSSPK